jgi:hypothetical protein
MIHRRVAWVFAAGVAFTACVTSPLENVGATKEAIHSCRAVCFAYARMTCRQVEEECGRNAGIVVIDGDPFPCEEAEPVACHLGTGDPLQACLDACGGSGEDYPYQGSENPHPSFSDAPQGTPSGDGSEGSQGGADLGGYE